MKYFILLLVTVFTFFMGTAQTSLSAGDIAFMGSNADGFTSDLDEVVFVVLKDIDAATQIIFTDRGWSDTGGFSNFNGDSEFTWTSGVARSAGDIVTIETSGLLPDGSLAIQGDQLFAIQGTIASPTFIAGLHYNEVAGTTTASNWDGDATSGTTSALPNALISGDTAVLLNPEQDNWQFSCSIAGANPITGTVPQIRAILHNVSNWRSNNTDEYSPALEAGCSVTVMAAGDSTPPSITCAPTPGPITANTMGMAPIPDLVSGSSATDDTSAPGNISITQSPTAGTMVSVGVNMVTVTATDEAGNTDSCMIDVTVVEPPSTTLEAGDIAFLGFNLDGNDSFSFVILKDVIEGTNIKFSDCGVTNPNTINCGVSDSANTWYAPSDLTAGNTVTIQGSTFFTTNLPGQGDQLFAYQGTESSPTFIAGIHSNVEDGITNDADWDGASVNSDESALPDQLTNGVNAIRLYTVGPPEADSDNWQFDCSLTPAGSLDNRTASQIAAVVNDLQYWINDDTTEFNPTTNAACAFDVAPSDFIYSDADGWMPNDPSLVSNASVSSSTIIVQSGTAPIAANFVIGNITVNSGAVLNLSPSIEATVHGNIINDGTFNAQSNSFVFEGNPSHSISGSSTITLGDLEIASGAAQTLTLNSTFADTGDLTDERILNLTGTLTLNNNTLVTNDELVFKSSATSTAIIGNTASATITGNVQVERYITAKRAYRLLTAPIGSGSIKDNWMEGVNNPDLATNLNPNPGFGTHISGAMGNANTWDETTTNNPSIFTVDEQALTEAEYVPLSSSAEVFAYGNGYLMLVRGDRSIDLSSNTSPATPTVLRANGALLTGSLTLDNTTLNLGDQPIGNGSSLIGNPYQTPVDMESVLNTAQEINPNFYHIYDPTIGDRGAFVTVTFGTPDTNSFSFTAPDGAIISDSDANRYLQPGQAAFVNTIDPGTPGTANPVLSFDEDDKFADATNENIFLAGQQAPGTMQSSLSIAMFQSVELADGQTPRDAVLIRFSDNFNSAVDLQDGLKAENFDENISTLINDRRLSIDSRLTPVETDIVQLETSNYRTDNYTFRINLSNLNNVQAFLYDAFLGTTTLIENNAQTLIDFSIDESDALSSSAERFGIIFQEEVLGQDEFGNLSFSIYPNPTEGLFNIQFDNRATGDASVTLYNLVGQKVFSNRYKLSGTNRLSIENPFLQAGVYLIEVKTETKTATQRVIIK